MRIRGEDQGTCVLDGSEVTDHGSRITDHGSGNTCVPDGSEVTDHGSRITDQGIRACLMGAKLQLEAVLTELFYITMLWVNYDTITL